jgi:acetyl-CoA carboxylase biotin carboxyl carrier protein
MSGEHEERLEEPMPETGLADDRPLVEPVAVGPGGPPAPAGMPPAGTGVPAPAEPSAAEARANGAGDGPSGVPVPAPIVGADASLLALVDQLTSVLERSDLGELEVAAGGTTIVLRAPSAVERQVMVGAPAVEAGALPAGSPVAPAPGPAAPASAVASARPSVRAPLTGIYYGAPSPGATPYVSVGDHVAVGQIIGLIEAMKLFNEIKSDLAGRVVRVCAENGALVKAKQPLIEVESA